MYEWTTEWPTEPGMYWFYGYRYGKDNDEKPEMQLLEVSKIANGFMYIAEGNFMYKSEVEEAHFQKAILPKAPKI